MRERGTNVAVLSNSLYNRLVKDFDHASFALFNTHGESVECQSLVNLNKTSKYISTKWNVERAAENLVPFSHAAILIRGKIAQLFVIPQIDTVGAGSLNIAFESES